MTDNIATSTGLCGYFKMQAVDSLTGAVRETGWIKNLITDYALNTMMSTAGIGWNPTFVAVGTGSTAPAFTDVQLTTPLGARTSASVILTSANIGSPTYYNYTQTRYTFPLGAIVGNVAEVGLFAGLSSATAYTHSLIKDGGGVPTTFPVLVTEQLFIIYEMRQYQVLTDTTGSITLNGISYNYLIRSCDVDTAASIIRLGQGSSFPDTASYCQAMQNAVTPVATTGTVSGTTNVSADSVVVTAYTTGTFYRDCEFTWIPTAAVFNWGGLRINTPAAPTYMWAMYFTSPTTVPKLNTQTMKFKFRYSLVRV
jgi:hypothetical protein